MVGTRTDKRMAQGFPNERLLVVPAQRLAAASRMPILRDIRVTHLGMFAEAESHYVSRRRGLSEHVLIYCLAGSGGGVVGRKEFSLGEGDLIVLPPGLSHRYHASSGFPWTIFWFHLAGNRVDDYIDALGAAESAQVIHCPETNELRLAFEATYRHALDGFSDSGLIGMTTEFIRMIGLFRRHSRSHNTRSRRAEDRILTVVRTLQDRIAEAWTVAAMAELAAMSPAHFTVRFKAQTGEAPLAYVIHQRMQRAAALLQHGNGSIGKMAESLGYDDVYYFSRLFRSVHGVSPREYRKRLMEGE